MIFNKKINFDTVKKVISISVPVATCVYYLVNSIVSIRANFNKKNMLISDIQNTSTIVNSITGLIEKKKFTLSDKQINNIRTLYKDNLLVQVRLNTYLSERDIFNKTNPDDKDVIKSLTDNYMK